MTEIHEAAKAHPSKSDSEGEDLSRAIRQSIERGPGEEVRCMRVYGDRYRCNWWIKDGDSGVAGRIVRSRFLKVTKTADGLLIEDLTG